jgi:SAM-dependent MidA family methyltransferase
MPFHRFMELALYHPEHGYYSAGAERLGREGDFFTASDVGNLFGACLARQLEEMDGALGRPGTFSVLEFGAGRGLLAADILESFSREPAGRLDYRMVDRAAGMRELASEQAPGARVVDPEDPGKDLTGCILAVELFDALPVRRIRRKEGELRELHVGISSDGDLVELEGAPSEEAVQLAERYGAAAEEGSEAEVCPSLEPVLESMDRTLERGFAILVDYGHPARELYGGRLRRGTLLAYHGHTSGEDYLRRVGEQDLTAHVNFTALEDAARDLGWTVLSLTTQDRFLIANGILERFEAAGEAEWSDPARVKERLRAMQLIHPQGMGRTFRVLVLCKGLDPAPELEGLRDPFARRARGGEGRQPV